MTTKVLLSWLWWLWWLWFLLLGPVERAEHRSLSRGVSRDRDRARAAFCAAGELVSRRVRRGAQGTASFFEGASDRVAFSLVTFFWRSKRKSPGGGDRRSRYKLLMGITSTKQAE